MANWCCRSCAQGSDRIGWEWDRSVCNGAPASTSHGGRRSTIHGVRRWPASGLGWRACAGHGGRGPDMTARLELFALPGLPMVRAGDDLASLILAGLERAGQGLRDRDVVVIAQKIVSKAEGRTVDLANVVPSAAALKLAAEIGKDPRIVEVVLRESVKVVRSRPNLIIMRHRLGFVMANAGVDRSNVAEPDGRHRALLLPLDPDGSAAAIRSRLAGYADVGVVISDSFGRPWRRGTAGVALGAAGIPSLIDLRGQPDLFGRSLEVSIA